VQHEELEESRDSAAAKVPFTEHVETVDESTQCNFELPVGIDHSTQSTAAETTDSSVQSDSLITVDANVQYEPIVSTETGVQALLMPETKDAEVQYELPEEAAATAVLPVDDDQDEYFDASSKPSSKNTTKQNNALKAILAAPLIAPALLASKLINKQKQEADSTRSDANDVATDATDVSNSPADKEEMAAVSDNKSAHAVVSDVTEPKTDKDSSAVVAVEKNEEATADNTSAHDVDNKDAHKADVVNKTTAIASDNVDTVTNNKDIAQVATGEPVVDETEKLYTKSETDAMIAAAIASALAAAAAAAAATGSDVKANEDNMASEDPHDDSVAESIEHHIPSEKALGKRPSSELHSNFEQDPMPSIITTPSSKDDLFSQEEMAYQSVQPAPANPLSRVGLSLHEHSKLPSEMSHGDKLESISISSVSTNNTNEQLQSVTSSNYDPRSGTDPNIIQLITQTMVGDWLYKYTRKMVGGGISEKRHQRYFWLHPYSRRLFWSSSAPITDGNEGKAKCAVIEDITVVSDPNTSPEGTPNVSLLIQTSHRQIKLTAPNINVHDRWFEAISYLLSRSGTGSGLTFLNSDKKAGEQASTNGGILRSSSSNGGGSLMQRASFRLHDALHHHHHHNQPTLTSAQSMMTNSDDYDFEDEALEDVRMCCNGKHHVSKLEKDRTHRHQYRKRRSQQSMNRQHRTIG
ncbi:hypothetical protein A0J61_09116, partial [Choanephora cucurbitarum]